jgi:hypothetical protein
MHASCLAHITIHYTVVLIIFGNAYKLRSSLLCGLPYPTISSFIGPDIILNNVFSDTFNLRPYLDKQPCKSVRKIIVACILILTASVD